MSEFQINTDPAISADERRHLLAGVNRAIGAFRQRLEDCGGGGHATAADAAVDDGGEAAV